MFVGLFVVISLVKDSVWFIFGIPIVICICSVYILLSFYGLVSTVGKIDTEFLHYAADNNCSSGIL
jgi:hypothetical protein